MPAVDMVLDTENDKYYYSETILNNIYGNAVVMAKSPLDISVLLAINNATGKMQYTINTLAEIRKGSAIWLDSDEGNVTVSFSTTFFPGVTGLRCRKITGNGSVGIVISIPKGV